MIASSLNIVSSSRHPLLARAIARSSTQKAIAFAHPQKHLSTVTAQVPTDSAPTRPQNSPNSNPTAGLRCISGCAPQYPAALAGEEGSARVRVVVDRNGNVVEAQVLGGSAVTEFLVAPNGNVVPKDGETTIYSKLAEAALASAKQMKFTPLANKEQAAVIVNIKYTIAGTDFDRQFRQRQERERQQQQERERQKQQKTEPIPATE
ncbi:TonB family protein [Allocoleopsis franciscana]|uniref:TonB family protein n=1 Tax=Allocoleopsis franciscana TaxID=2886352 RepID=UPI0012DBF2A2|nr:TonB family protein [Allocoleopsis franciscana]